jgi:hypothetical protein
MRLFADQEFRLMTEVISPFQARKYNINRHLGFPAGSRMARYLQAHKEPGYRVFGFRLIFGQDGQQIGSLPYGLKN